MPPGKERESCPPGKEGGAGDGDGGRDGGRDGGEVHGEAVEMVGGGEEDAPWWLGKNSGLRYEGCGANLE